MLAQKVYNWHKLRVRNFQQIEKLHQINSKIKNIVGNR